MAFFKSPWLSRCKLFASKRRGRPCLLPRMGAQWAIGEPLTVPMTCEVFLGNFYVFTSDEGLVLCGESLEILPRLGLCGWVVVAVQMEFADLWNQLRIYNNLSVMHIERRAEHILLGMVRLLGPHPCRVPHSPGQLQHEVSAYYKV